MARRRKIGKRGGVSGFRSLTKKLRKMGPAVQETVKPALQKVVDAVYADTLKRLPVREGDLAASLKKQVKPNGLSARVGWWQKGNKKNWELAGWRAHFMEFGTLHASPSPSLRPGYRENIDFAKKTIDKGVDKALRKVARGG